jgi:hypothetical protein
LVDLSELLLLQTSTTDPTTKAIEMTTAPCEKCNKTRTTVVDEEVFGLGVEEAVRQMRFEVAPGSFFIIFIIF